MEGHLRPIPMEAETVFEPVAGGTKVTIVGRAEPGGFFKLGIAELFIPLRRRVQDLIDRRFYRRRNDAERTLAAFADRIRDEVDVGRLTGELVGVVEQTMQPAHASLWLRGAERTTGGAERGAARTTEDIGPRGASRLRATTTNDG